MRPQQKKARAEWEAQMAQIQSVLAPMNRAELIGESATKGSLDAEVVSAQVFRL